MSWMEARDLAIRRWLAIRETVGVAPREELLASINAIDAMCREAEKDAPDPWTRCDFCLFYREHGGCHELNEAMSRCVVEGRWDRLRGLIDEVVDLLRTLPLPAPTG